jgi:hypothetical protein
VSCHDLHGYRMETLDELARRAAAITARFRMPFPERAGIARGAIAEWLCRADGHVEPLVLVTVGARAVKNENLAGIHQSGTRQGELMPRFETYWRWTCRHTDSPEEWIVEHLAFWQVWTKLSERDRAVLKAIAGCRVYAKAAAELGMAYAAYRSALHRARAKAYHLWFSPETPPGKWGTDRPVSHAQARDYLTTYAVRRRKLSVRRLAACGEGDGSSSANWARRGTMINSTAGKLGCPATPDTPTSRQLS